MEDACTFLLAKRKIWKSIFHINSELSQHLTEKQIVPLETTLSWLFNDMWCCLVITLFIENWRFSTNSGKGLLYP